MYVVSTTRLIAAASITSSLAISDVPTNNWSICFLVALLVATAYNEILLFVAQTTSPKVLQAFTKHRSNNASEGGPCLSCRKAVDGKNEREIRS